MKKPSMSILLAVLGTPGLLSAASVELGKGDVLKVSNADAATQSEPVRMKYDARGVEKSGTGRYTLPRGTVNAANPFGLTVREGCAVLTTGGSVPAVTEEPTALMNFASFWLKASANVTTINDEDVTMWFDCREANSGGVFGASYPRGATIGAPLGEDSNVYSPVPPRIETRADVHLPMVNFGGLGTGTGMQLRNGADAAMSFSSIRHLYLVIDLKSSYGWPLGTPNGSATILHPTHYGKGIGVVGNYASTDTHPNTVRGEFLVNGKRVNPVQTAVKSGLQLIELHADNHRFLAHFGEIFNDRGIAGRFGGDSIGELLVYNDSKSLTLAERHQIQSYLMHKWGIAPETGTVDVKLAKGATVEFSADVKATVSGNGLMVKAGEGTVTHRPTAAERRSGVSVAVADGALVADVRELNYAPKAGDTVTEASDSFARRTVSVSNDANDAAAGRVAFAGAGPAVRLGDLDPAIKAISSDSKELVLGTAVLGGEQVTAGAGGATIANASFESDISENDWVIVVKEHVSRVSLCSASDANQWYLLGNDGNYRPSNFFATDGNYAFWIRNIKAATCNMYGHVTVGTDGDYLLSFEGTGRPGYDNLGITFTLEDDATGVVTPIGTCIVPSGDGFRPFRLPVKGVKRGNYKLRLVTYPCRCHNWDWGEQEADAFLDNFRLDLLPTTTFGAVAVPNGTFEQTKPEGGRTIDLFGTSQIDCAGWTFTAPNSGTDVAPVSRLMSLNYIAQTSPYGEWQLRFNGNAGVATSAPFTLPAGRWQFRCQAAKWAYANNQWNGQDGRNANPVVGVKVLVNGEERFDATSGAITGYDFWTVTLPNVLQVAATDQVVLELRQPVANGMLNIDDIEFVPAEEELVKNQTFAREMDYWGCSSSYVYTFGAGADVNYGNYRFDDEKAMCLMQAGSFWQNLDFPSAGLYRLSFWARSRVSSYNGYPAPAAHGGNSVRAVLVDADSNRLPIVETAPILSTNFFETVALFRIPQKGMYTLRFEGVDSADRTSFVDLVSVKPVVSADAPNVSEDLELSLAEGSRLRLDFEGEVKVKGLKIGKKKFHGKVDASHASGLVCGVGSLSVPETGLSIIVR